MPKLSHLSYGAVIQLRPFKEEIYSYIINQCKKYEVNIVNQKRFDKGIDIYIESQKIIRTLGRKLKRNFKGVMKITYSLYTFDATKCKKIFKSTLLFRAE